MNLKETYYKNIRQEMLAFVPENCKRILEVGCASGYFGAAIKQRNEAEVWGAELSPEAGKIAQTNLDRVLIGDFNTVLSELPLNYFDCVIFNDVLEHFTNPDEVLLKLRPCLSDNSVIVSSIPNVRYVGNLFELMVKKDWEYKSDGILDYTHYRFFTEKSIRRMFEKAGYHVTLMKGINPAKSILTRLIVLFTLGYYSDIQFLEYATVANYKR